MARRLVAAALLLLIPTRGDDGGRCHIEVVVDGAARRLETSVPPPERPELVAGARDFAEDLLRAPAQRHPVAESGGQRAAGQPGS